MGLLGNIIKGALNITSEFDLDLKNDEKKQLAMLSQLLTKAQNTAFGKFYDFQSVLHQGDLGGTYRKHVPIFEYNEMYDRWWQQQLIRPDITWPGQPKFYARTSGTTGSESKRIPITEEFISSMRKVGFDLIKGLAAYDLEDEIFESEVLTISSTASLDRHKEGHLEGEISGINIYNLPDWYDLFHRPGKDIARIPEWDDRLEQIVKAAPQWDIGFIAGIPSWVLQVLKAVVKRYDLDDIRDLWPRLRVYMSGGVAFGTYEESFRKLCGDSLLVIDTYLASEGFFAFSNIPGQLDMQLALEHGYYYEFIPFDSTGFDDQGNLLEDPECVDITGVTQDKEYALVVSTCAGAWRFLIGDTVKFTSLDPYRILITGRTKFFLNVVGSQLSEEKLDTAVTFLSQEKGVQINEYTVGAIKGQNDEYIHQWILVTDGEKIDTGEAAGILDKKLKELNHNYEVARRKALGAVNVQMISKERYLDWIKKQKKLGGQVKIPKVMKEDDLRDYMTGLSN